MENKENLNTIKKLIEEHGAVKIMTSLLENLTIEDAHQIKQNILEKYSINIDSLVGSNDVAEKSENEKDVLCNVVMTGVGENKLNAYKYLKANLEKSLGEIKTICDNLPFQIAENVDANRRKELEKELTEKGIQYEIQEA